MIFRKIEAATDRSSSLVVHFDVIPSSSSSSNHHNERGNISSCKKVYAWFFEFLFPNKNLILFSFNLLTTSITISKPANQAVDLRQLAAKILQKCGPLIPKLRLPELMAALLQLLSRKRTSGGSSSHGILSSTAAAYEYPFVMQNFLSSTSTLFFASSSSESSSSSNSGSISGSISSGDETRNSSSSASSNSTSAPNFDATAVSLGQLDLYIELLYEELEEKIRGALAILALVATRPEHLGRLAKNDTLLSALSRVLREDGKKSLELSIYIAAIFAHLSNYVDFHSVISNVSVLIEGSILPKS